MESFKVKLELYSGVQYSYIAEIDLFGGVL